MINAVVTGANGFIGSRLIKELADNGYRVYALVRDDAIPYVKANEDMNISYIHCNAENLISLPNIINDSCDYFFHLAWTGATGQSRFDFNVQQANCKLTVSALHAAKELGCKRFIGAGSIFEDECKLEMDLHNMPPSSTNVYKAAKLFAHYSSKMEAQRLGIEYIWPVITNVYGPGERNLRFLSYFVNELINGREPALTKGEQLYDFIYISDAVSAFRVLAENGISFSKYFIGSGDVKPLRQYLTQVRDIINPSANLRFGSMPYNGVELAKNMLTNTNLLTDTGFTPTVSFHDGITYLNDFLKGQKYG